MHIKVGDTVRHIGWDSDVSPIKIINIINDCMFYDTLDPANQTDHCWPGMPLKNAYYVYISNEWIVVRSSNLKDKSGWGYEHRR